MNRNLIYLFICSLFVFSSCSNDDDIDYTAPGKLAGEWWVTCYTESAPGNWAAMDDKKNVALSTYNTANNTADEIFVDDKGHFWDFKVKVKANPGKLSFGSENKCPNYSYENCDVTVTDGKVLFGVGKSKTGLQTDSICFYVKFSDDKDNLTYKVAGHKRTGWTFDEY